MWPTPPQVNDLPTKLCLCMSVSVCVCLCVCPPRAPGEEAGYKFPTR